MRFGRFLFALVIVIAVQVAGDVVLKSIGQQTNALVSGVLAIVVGLVLWKMKAGIGGDVTKVATGLFVLDLILISLFVAYGASAAARAGSTDLADVMDVVQEDFSNLDQWLLDFFRFFIPEQVEQYEEKQRQGDSTSNTAGPPTLQLYEGMPYRAIWACCNGLRSS